MLAALALSGPASERGAVSTFRNLDGLVLAFDVSRSLASGGNLAAARIAAARAAAAAAPRPVALVAYAGDVYLASSFTTDPAALDATLAALDGDTVPDAGSRPARALAMAGRLLAEAHILQGDVLLISDGGGVDRAAVAQARALDRAGQTVSALFVPATAALPDGAPRPDRAALDVLAAAGGGVAGDLGPSPALLDQLGEHPVRRLAHSDFAALAYLDLGRLVLLLALLPAALLFRRRA